MCGGTVAGGEALPAGGGLSPRVRGNRISVSGSADSSGSIPACAGEPPAFRLLPPLGRVYPRVCGGTFVRPAGRARAEGLSPRVRGNPDSILPGGIVSGSIPACAGEPPPLPRSARGRGVYPRVCGGTGFGRGIAQGHTGLSPRVRGNQIAAARPEQLEGSIPACAGEPTPGVSGERSKRVYPRVCGGTVCGKAHLPGAEGLSPRVRGNLLRPVSGGHWRGSIPACAGEPDFVYCFNDGGGVYPRVCGGTFAGHFEAALERGLSPRVRGNPWIEGKANAMHGSIPACAGEPPCQSRTWRTWRVYPRVCGGTLSMSISTPITTGLSPRVRGNPSMLTSLLSLAGSIPACAGEPTRSAASRRRTGVYPRVCGGTPDDRILARPAQGLSPRVRGNLKASAHEGPLSGSIPACAGEPVLTPA